MEHVSRPGIVPVTDGFPDATADDSTGNLGFLCCLGGLCGKWKGRRGRGSEPATPTNSKSADAP